MTKPRIGRYSAPSDALGPVSNESWRRIEAVYQIDLTDEDRAELSDIRAQYANWRQAEIYGARKEDSDAVLRRLEEAAEGLRFLASFTGSSDDAAAAIAFPLKKAFAQHAVKINPRHLLAIADDGTKHVRAIEDDYLEPLFVSLSRELVSEVSRSVAMSLASVRRGLAEEEGGFLKGDALVALDRNLRAWAEGKGLATGVTKNDARAVPLYQQFIEIVDATLPSSLKTFNSGAAAAAARILEARKKA